MNVAAIQKTLEETSAADLSGRVATEMTAKGVTSFTVEVTSVSARTLEIVSDENAATISPTTTGRKRRRTPWCAAVRGSSQRRSLRSPVSVWPRSPCAGAAARRRVDSFGRLFVRALLGHPRAPRRRALEEFLVLRSVSDLRRRGRSGVVSPCSTSLPCGWPRGVRRGASQSWPDGRCRVED